jgi:hypothetical protein
VMLDDNVRRPWLRGGTETRMLTGRRRTDVEKLTDRLNAPVQGTAADGLKLALLAGAAVEAQRPVPWGPCRFACVTRRWSSSATQNEPQMRRHTASCR